MFALMIGAMFPIIHLGKPWLFFWLAPYPSAREIWPNFRSPLVWDFFAINTYLTGSLLFLLLPMIPDFALVRDRSTGWRKRVYGALALGWQGTTKQWHRLESAMQIMAIAIIPVAVSVHTIVSFDFSMATVPMWHSTIFGPYFVAGAIFSGIAALIIAMAALRKLLHLEAYLHPVHFENLGKLLLLMSLLWGYFVFAERLTVWYGNEHSEMAVFWATQRGAYAPLYWTMVVCNFVLPLPILGAPPAADDHRHGRGVAAACCVGMWLERYLIIVPSLGHKPLPYSWGTYSAAAGRDLHHGRHLRGDGAALHAVRQVRADHLDLGDEGRQSAASRRSPRRRPTRRGRPALWKARAMSAIYGLYADPDAAQRAVDGAARPPASPMRDIVVMSSEPFEEYEFSHRDKADVAALDRRSPAA